MAGTNEEIDMTKGNRSLYSLAEVKALNARRLAEKREKKKQNILQANIEATKKAILYYELQAKEEKDIDSTRKTELRKYARDVSKGIISPEDRLEVHGARIKVLKEKWAALDYKEQSTAKGLSRAEKAIQRSVEEELAKLEKKIEEAKEEIKNKKEVAK